MRNILSRLVSADLIPKVGPVKRLLVSLWNSNPWLTVAVVALRLVRALQPALVLYVAKLIIDQVVAQMALPPEASMEAWIDSGRVTVLGALILLEFVLAIVFVVVGRVSSLAETVLTENHGDTIASSLISHAARLDLKDIESAEFQDSMQRARVQTMTGSNLLSRLLGQAQDLVTLASLMVGIVLFVPVLVFLLLFALVPAVVAESYFNDETYRLDTASTEKRRQMEYVRFIGSSPQAAKEIKLFGLGTFLMERYLHLARDLRKARLALGLRRTLWGSLFAALGLVAYYVSYVVVVWQTINGHIGLGELTFLGGALLRLNGLFERIMVGFTQLALQSKYLMDLFAFLDMPVSIVKPEHPKPFPSPLRKGIVLENVGFHYPGKAEWAVRNLSFEIAAGETVALVGENGAGKTTIVKLLARLYDPQEGRILVDGIDLRDLDPETLRQHEGILFQDFLQYNMTVNENVGLGAVARLDDLDGITDAARMSGADAFISGLPNRYDQMLGRNFFKGFDLSGGEWQKIAVARAYFRKADFQILDEPTAALDARAEAELFQRLSTIRRERTTLLISHRFSTVRTADQIVVVEHGKVLEQGRHSELMAAGGKYAELFTLQASGYL